MIRRVCWEITDSCNLHCGFCHRYYFQNNYYDIKNLNKTIELLKEKNIENVIISGGEPLLHPQLFDIMNELKANGFDLDICTNATLLDQETIDKLSYYINEISVSLDGYNALRHEGMRNTVGCFEKTVNNIKLLISNGFDVHITTVVDEKFAKEIVIMSNYLDTLGVKSISFLGLIPLNSGKNPLLSKKTQQVLNEQVREARNQHPNLNINTKQLLINSTCSCGAGTVIRGMGTDGTVLYPCLLMRTRRGIPMNNTGEGLCPGSKYLTQRKD